MPTTDPYLLASEPNVRFVSVVTSGDPLPGGGVFGGIPDGIGAFDNGDGTITVLVNHEFPSASGPVQDHGSTGAYIDLLTIDKATLQITASNDLIQTVHNWDDLNDTYVTGTASFSRFCSGDLPATSALYNSQTGLGTTARIYLTGEEQGTEGRATATIVTGDGAQHLYELPSLGNLAFENVAANPFEQDKTIVAVTDDGTNGQVYIYIGDKQSTGTDIEKAGLSGGDFFGIKVDGFVDEANGTPISGNFTLQEIGAGGDVSNMTGAQIDAESEAEQVTSFLRPEDFAWDPQNPNVAYFTTTNSFDGVSRIYQLTFTDIAHPELGGTIQAVVESDDYGAHMFDNLTVANGKVIVNEDPGNNAYVARVWEYDIASGSFHELAGFNPDQFAPGGSQFITQDEESSGVIDVTDLLGDSDTNAYLLDAQVHTGSPVPGAVEQGQLMVMYVDDPFLVGGNANDNLFGSAADEELRGNNGNDVALAGSGDDTAFGGNGNDTLVGHAGNDNLLGERGDDVLVGGAGDDNLTGGQGADLLIFDNRAATGNDTISDFAKGDKLLTIVALEDADGDGVIAVGDSLALFSDSSVDINNGNNDVTALKSAGTVVIDGTIYFAYVAAGSAPSSAAAPAAAIREGHVTVDDIRSMMHLDHEQPADLLI